MECSTGSIPKYMSRLSRDAERDGVEILFVWDVTLIIGSLSSCPLNFIMNLTGAKLRERYS